MTNVYAYTLEHGGGTFRPDTLEPIERGGWAVGRASGTYRTVDIDTPPTLAECIIGADIAAIRRRWPGACIGTWLDHAHRCITLDPIIILPSRSMALGYAWATRQDAVYHLDTGSTLYLGDRLGEYREED